MTAGEQATEEVREVLKAYDWENMRKLYREGFAKFETESFGNPDLAPVVNAIIHALTAKYPSPAYKVGWALKERLGFEGKAGL